MGGLVGADPGAARIRTALAEKQEGSPLEFHRLQHALAGGDPADVAELLTGLTHFSALISHDASDESLAADLRVLVHAALEVDLLVCAAPSFTLSSRAQEDDATAETITESDSAAYPTLNAFRLFVMNLVSADAAFVEPVLVMFAKRAFTLPLVKREPAVRHVYAVISMILSTHPRSSALLARIATEKYPHPVRPEPEHCAYARSVLHVARECHSQALRGDLISTVIEKVVAVEALVPRELFAEPADEMPPPPPRVNFEAGAEEPDSDACEGGHLIPLVKEAEKIDSMLSELCLYIDLAYADTPTELIQKHFDPLFTAFERFVLPVQGARFAPFVLLYAASVGGAAVVLDVVERLRQSFFDPSKPEGLRVHHLQYSSAMVICADLVSANDVVAWMSPVAQWLNNYIDAHDRRAPLYTENDIDTDVHNLFYTAACALMITVCRRTDAFDGGSCADQDAIARMRLFRIMSSKMNPMLVISKPIVDEFADVVLECDGMDLSEILEENKFRFIPSLTRFGARNRFTYSTPMEPLALPRTKRYVQRFMRVEPLSDEDLEEEKPWVVASGKDIARLAPSLLSPPASYTGGPSAMILSTSLA